MICFHHEQFFGKVFERKADKCCSILKSYGRNSEAHRVINLEMAKILKEKGFNDVLPGQKLCRQCLTKHEKLPNHLKMRTQQKLLRQRVYKMNQHQMIIFCCTSHQKRNLTRLSKALEFPQLLKLGFPNTVMLQMEKLN